MTEAATMEWEERVAEARAEGGVVFQKNGLPIVCIRHDGALLEHEHADHPDYKYPVEVEFVGEIPEFADLAEDVRAFERSLYAPHKEALIYSDESIAVTLYECCYTMWIRREVLGYGDFLQGLEWAKKWRLSSEAAEKIWGDGPLAADKRHAAMILERRKKENP
jgi:hypothetical protein